MRTIFDIYMTTWPYLQGLWFICTVFISFKTLFTWENEFGITQHTNNLLCTNNLLYSSQWKNSVKVYKLLSDTTLGALWWLDFSSASSHATYTTHFFMQQRWPRHLCATCHTSIPPASGRVASPSSARGRRQDPGRARQRSWPWHTFAPLRQTLSNLRTEINTSVYALGRKHIASACALITQLVMLHRITSWKYLWV